MGRRVIVAAYRGWAVRMWTLGAAASVGDWRLMQSPLGLTVAHVEAFRPTAVLLIGWSWIVPPEIYERWPTICAHPSPLPRYRGGSPLQHQIINGEDTTRLTFFRVTGGAVDSGPVYAQSTPIALDGSLAEIFERISAAGEAMLPEVLAMVEHGERGAPQPEALATTFARRRPEESEITPGDLARMTARQFRDKVRALAHVDYPRAFIRVGGEPVELWEVR